MQMRVSLDREVEVGYITLVRFSEITRRLTGFSTPVFGVSWDPGESQVAVARRVIAFLEDRRVLFNPYHLEDPMHCIESVTEIRRYLTAEIGQLPESDEQMRPHLVAMRAACRRFMTEVGPAGLRGRPPMRTGPWAIYQTLFQALGELRAIVGTHVAHLAVKFGIDVENELAAILPADPDAADDDGHLDELPD